MMVVPRNWTTIVVTPSVLNTTNSGVTDAISLTVNDNAFLTPKPVKPTRLTTRSTRLNIAERQSLEYVGSSIDPLNDNLGRTQSKFKTNLMTILFQSAMYARTTLVQLDTTVWRQLLHLVELFLHGQTLPSQNLLPRSFSSSSLCSLSLRTSQVMSVLTKLVWYYEQ